MIRLYFDIHVGNTLRLRKVFSVAQQVELRSNDTFSKEKQPQN